MTPEREALYESCMNALMNAKNAETAFDAASEAAASANAALSTASVDLKEKNDAFVKSYDELTANASPSQ